MEFMFSHTYSYCTSPPHSGGTGRTGTFITITNLLDRLNSEGVVDVFQTVRTLRLQRPHMVRNVVSGCPSSLKHFIVCCNISCLISSHFIFDSQIFCVVTFILRLSPTRPLTGTISLLLHHSARVLTII